MIIWKIKIVKWNLKICVQIKKYVEVCITTGYKFAI